MAQSTQDLTKLLVRVGRDSDEQAFRELHDALAPRIKAYMMRQGANGDLAEELAQEVMVRVWRKANMFSPDKGAATTWAYTIARNLRIDRIRRERVWDEMPDGYDDTPDQADLPDEQVSTDERATRVREALQELPPDQAEVIELSFLDGLSHSEIAEKLSTPLGTVKSRMRLAYGRLQQHLTQLR
ncbi:MAG: sigma-70 family RNA polymerase sigma factor [Pseudomonadota bacterium]